jgi:hypothetical protein
VDYNPASVGQLPNESTAVIIFERPDGDRNYGPVISAVAVFLAQAVPPATDSKPPPKTMSRVARSIFSPCWEGSNPCASTRSSHLPDAFPPQSKSCAACSPRGWRPIAPGTGTSGSGVLPVSGGHAKGPLARRRCRTRPDRDAASPGTEGSNPASSRREMVWGRRRGDGTIVAAAN